MLPRKPLFIASVFSLLSIGSISSSFAYSRFFNFFHASQGPTADRILSQARHLNPDALRLGLIAYENARKHGLDSKKILTIVDYSAPSTEKRLWTIDLKEGRVIYNALVSHGRNSGENYATAFSNSPSSNQSSLGVFLTGDTYTGKHGFSMRLQGLEPGVNNNAYNRAIVMHSAWYVSDAMAHMGGRLGRSNGCFALDTKDEPKVVNTIKNGTILFAYYPDKSWISHSRFLKASSNVMSA